MKPTDILCWGLEPLPEGKVREVIVLKAKTKRETPRVILGPEMTRRDYDRMRPWEQWGARLPKRLNVELDLFLQEVEKRSQQLELEVA